MDFFQEILLNRVLLVAVVAWFAAQTLKVVFHLIIERELDFRRFFGLGGMPSSHACVVCGLATAVGLTSGFNSASFAICVVLASVVMTDAAGVRRSAGQQASLLNRLVQQFFEGDHRNLDYKSLKEMLGHSPFEVLIGALIGILIAFYLI